MPRRFVHCEQRHADLEHREVVDALADGHGLAEEVEHAHARDRLGVLEAEEHAAGRPVGGAEVGDVLALEPDAAGRDHVAGVGEEGLGQGGLAGAVGPHEGVELALAHREGHAAEDLGVLRRGRGGPASSSRGCGGRNHGSIVIPTIPVVEIPSRISGPERSGEAAQGEGEIAGGIGPPGVEAEAGGGELGLDPRPG